MKRRNIFLVSLLGALSFTDAFQPLPFGWSGLPEVAERLLEAGIIAMLLTLIGPSAYENFMSRRAGHVRNDGDE